MKTIYNTYVVMESQEQCGRMKQLCIDNDLPIWVFYKHLEDESVFSKIDMDFWVTDVRSIINRIKKKKTQVTEKEFIELLKIKKQVGRPSTGRKPYKVMCNPENITKIREWIKTNDY